MRAACVTACHPPPLPGNPWLEPRPQLQAAGEGTGGGSWDSHPPCHSPCSSPPGTPSPGQGSSPSHGGPHDTLPCAPWVLPHDRHVETRGPSVTGRSRGCEERVCVPWAPRQNPTRAKQTLTQRLGVEGRASPPQCRRRGLAARPRRGYVLSPRATLSLSLLRKAGLRSVNLPGFPDACSPFPCDMAALSGSASPCHAWWQ